jgi:peptidoglycan/xylan/chitin deacetylase (PgdA/CDA1 family)
MLQVALSFDDSFVDQYKWARTLGELHIPATFYVSPGLIGRPLCLSRTHLNAIAGWGHLIGNHTWEHEAPKKCGVEVAVESAVRAMVWLEAEGFHGDLFAMPYGSRGGGWDQAAQTTLRARGLLLRDVRFEGEPLTQGALESTSLKIAPTGLDQRYFHSNFNTTDDSLAALFFHLAAERDAGRLTILLPKGP